MKKKLSIIFIFLITITMCTGCVMSAGSAELDAAYQLKDVSEYKFEVASDEYLEDPLSNTNAASEYAAPVAVEEGDPRLANTYTYEELAACFTMVTELNASNLGEYFSLETLPYNDEYNEVQMNAKEGFYISNVLVMKFMNKNGGYEQQQYEPLWMFGSFTKCEKKDTSWTTEKFKTVELVEKSYIYTFSPTEEMWTNYDDTQAIYVTTQKENSHGEYLLIEAYENNPTEISYMLRVISETGLLGGSGSSATPDSGSSEETPAPTPTPDGGSSEETPAPTPTPTPEQKPANGIEGVYWVTYDAYGEGGKKGFYLDGNGKYTILLTDGTIYEYSYEEITTSTVSDGTEYIIYGDEMGGMAYILGYDGNVYYEWDDGWSGGRDTYVAVSEAEFYGN